MFLYDLLPLKQLRFVTYFSYLAFDNLWRWPARRRRGTGTSWRPSWSWTTSTMTVVRSGLILAITNSRKDFLSGKCCHLSYYFPLQNSPSLKFPNCSYPISKSIIRVTLIGSQSCRSLCWGQPFKDLYVFRATTRTAARATRTPSTAKTKSSEASSGSVSMATRVWNSPPRAPSSDAMRSTVVRRHTSPKCPKLWASLFVNTLVLARPSWKLW